MHAQDAAWIWGPNWGLKKLSLKVHKDGIAWNKIAIRPLKARTSRTRANQYQFLLQPLADTSAG